LGTVGFPHEVAQFFGDKDFSKIFDERIRDGGAGSGETG
jgi:hypothetical protein